MNQPSLTPTADLLCPDCDYNLRGLTSDRCPSCGWRIDAADLLDDARRGKRVFHVGLILASAVLGAGSLLGVSQLSFGGQQLALRDGLAVLGVLMAAGGHLTLATLLIISGRRRLIASRETYRSFCLVALFSVAVGIAGATTTLQQSDAASSNARRIVRGVVVTNAFEFVLAASLFSFPGLTLLLLSSLSYRRRGAARRSRSTGGQSLDPSRVSAAPFDVELFGPYRPNQVQALRSETRRPTSPSLERTIDQSWEALCALGRVEQRTIYDGNLGRLVRASATPERLTLELAATTFREFVGTNVDNAAAVIASGDASWLANPLGTSATIISQDGFLLFGRRSETVAFHAGCLHPLGGILDDRDKGPDGCHDVVGSIYRELFEEAAIARTEVTDCTIVGLVSDRRWHQPELLFDVSVSLTRVDLILRMEKARDAGEHSGIESVPDQSEALLRFLDEATPLTPIAEAAILLHGRHRWGADWYEAACRDRYGGLPSDCSA